MTSTVRYSRLRNTDVVLPNLTGRRDELTSADAEVKSVQDCRIPKAFPNLNQLQNYICHAEPHFPRPPGRPTGRKKPCQSTVLINLFRQVAGMLYARCNRRQSNAWVTAIYYTVFGVEVKLLPGRARPFPLQTSPYSSLYQNRCQQAEMPTKPEDQIKIKSQLKRLIKQNFPVNQKTVGCLVSIACCLGWRGSFPR